MNTPQDSSRNPPADRQASGSPGTAHADNPTEELAQKARAEGQEQVQHYRDAAADKVDTLADSVKAAASELEGGDVAHLSGHVADLAGSLGRLADGLREKSADDILRDVRRAARDNPALFIAGSIAVGFGIARFARASGSSTSEAGARDTGRRASSPSRDATDTHTRGARWSDPDSAVPGTTAKPATGNDSVDTTSPDRLTGAMPAAPGPSASTADAISARAGATASDTPAGWRNTPSATDDLRGRNQP